VVCMVWCGVCGMGVELGHGVPVFEVEPGGDVC
jgi:hypothetical protein